MRCLIESDFKPKSLAAWRRIAHSAGWETITDYLVHYYHDCRLSYRRIAHICGRSRADVGTRIVAMGITRTRGGNNNPHGRNGAEKHCEICGTVLSGKQRTLCLDPSCRKERARQWAADNYTRNRWQKPKPKVKSNKGIIFCLKCENGFLSWDTTLNRICPLCSVTNGKRTTGEEYGGMIAW